VGEWEEFPIEEGKDRNQKPNAWEWEEKLNVVCVLEENY